MAFNSTLEEKGSTEQDFEFVSCPPSPSVDALYASELFDDSSRKDLPRSIAFRCSPLSESQFRSFFDSAGRLVDEHAFKKSVFRGGSEKCIQPEVWLYLFSFYPCSSTSAECQAILTSKRAQYVAIKNKWLDFVIENYPDFDLNQVDNCIADDKPAYAAFVNTCSPAEYKKSWENFGVVQNVSNKECRDTKNCDEIEAEIFAKRLELKPDYLIECLRYVARDVPRTERSHSYFALNDTPHLIELRDALITFCILNPDMGYVQGMNDLMARFLVVLESEILAFWCFNDYMLNVRDEFSPAGMVRKISLMVSLLKRLDGDLYSYLASHGLSDLVFCHKWLLLCFQREFQFDEGLRLLEIVSTRHIGSKTPLGLTILEELRKERQDLDVNVECEMTNHDYAFDLFISIAILTLSRHTIIQQTNDDSDVLLAILSSPLNLKLDDVLNEAEKLFYMFCRKSVLYSF